VRLHLDMDVAFVSEFVGRKRYFRNVDARTRSPIHIGDSMPLSEGYCQRVVDGSLPELIPNTAFVALATSLPETFSVPIGAHLSVPIRLKSGRVYGTFCCFNFASDESLNERDLSVMRAFADIAAHQIDHELEESAIRNEKSRRILSAIDSEQPGVVYQPIVSLADLSVVGIECLSRFDLDPYRGPDHWFAEAADIGHGTVLELQAIRNVLRGLQDVELGGDMQIWLNLSARTLIDGGVIDHLRTLDLGRIVLELTEHEHVADYAVLNRALAPLRDRGVRVAIDDAGAGYSSMSHILNMSPDFIKLDLSLTRHIDIDRKRRALAAALIEFARQTDATIVAEGVESVAELNELRRLGVQLAQGYFLSEPVGIDALVAVLATFRDRAP
jgi:EAL domain-containing protein (putative c-di-GMP-specific phosphodiesterase class I)